MTKNAPMRTSCPPSVIAAPFSSNQLTPGYPHSHRAGPGKRYVLNFKASQGDGVRIIGTPGGEARFTTVAELGAYYAG